MIYLLTWLGWYTPTPVPTVKPNVGYQVEMYLDATLELVPPKGTTAQVKYTKDMILRVSKKVFGRDIETAKNFITLLAIESRFDVRAKSSAGAIGLAQVIARFAPEFGSRCGLVFESQDMDVPELNVTAGACQFKYLVEKHGSTSLALVAYNAGTYSKSVKSMKVMSGVSNLETANYVTKHTYVKELTTQGETK
jgi:hypothetical protein